MNRTNCLVVLLLLLLAASMFAQQPVPQTTPSPSGSTPPTFPPDTSAPKPTQKASEKPPRPLTSQEVKIQIVQKLLTTPGLDSKNINVKVSNDKVELKGSVPSADQRILAEQVVQLSAGNRRIENRLSMATKK